MWDSLQNNWPGCFKNGNIMGSKKKKKVMKIVLD